ncbi:DeoR/GlpR transcriptional regulator [Peribacillus cavernae]|uniref:DeoR/GlpR transcriptional regulator n=1 Tax=Peribacillus cavernae TaxID=1674310 RepID=A0A3S1B482_9BACI|nr:DeoR/GlpR family DNA-binding transcription regulator [Peribacillus cavernae]MDQ0217697.1 DeoR/GlpR family transcriptional regulator of sugar metabolism [Peribacillus cavernae]RUQ28167.1 DeoR/GlpR transcriptional regulator [Peribacillus cavernae]
MLPLERKLQILKQIEKDGKVEIEELVDRLNVSSMTIRRDLNHLEKEGKIVRTHGGALPANVLIAETPYIDKSVTKTEQKRSIARYAATLIPTNSNIILDSGTTTLEIAKEIKMRDDLTIVTNDLKIAAELLDCPSQVICTGGSLQKGVGAMFGPHAQSILKQIRVDILFLGTHAIDLRAGLSAPTMEKALIKQMMIESASKTWVAADSSKFNKCSFSQVCPLQSVEAIITDSELSDTDEKLFNEYVKIQIVEEGGEEAI